jgi:glycosyltransferase involved in cell wall biosynthesis
MRIAIDASRITIAKRTGTENYALQLLRALLALPEARAHQFTLYFRQAPAPDLLPSYPNVIQRVIPFRRAWTHLRFAVALWQTRPDVAFVPAHTLPLLFPGRGVVTIHDLGYRFFPQAHPAWQRLYLDLSTRFSAKRAGHILADSRATQADLQSEYGVPAGKIRVVYPGVAALAPANASEIARVRLAYNLPARYLLFLGTLQPRKNIGRLAEAFAAYIASQPQSDLGLVLAGNTGWLFDLERDVLAALPTSARARLLVTGYVKDADVAALYTGAAAFVFPSLYEGFGFPVIEALACGTPVVCSATSSLPELGAGSTVLVDPLRTESITAGIAEVLAWDSATRAARQSAGQQAAASFTWGRAAAQALAALTEW